MTPKSVARTLLAIAMTAIGVDHFVNPAPFAAMVPHALPVPVLLVYLSGAAEIAGGVGLIPARTRRLAAIGLIALYICVFPANVNMAVNHLPLGDQPVPDALLWARLPLQAVFVAWAYFVGIRGERRRDGA